ncbi:MAG TPA: gliding motility-associated C-terminal domain-containing protein, partial [Cyclobacteriaceae bacterium]|nr:gliding motility-associated C-terminal domain-containing protein [Cyclobacteriaceae bacterium]
DHPQIINHNDQSFSRLTISGGGEKIFLADITIENELDLTDGILVSQNDSRIVFSNDAGFTGGSDASHVRGPVYHRGAGDKIFPVGNGSAYLPVELRNIQGASAEVGIQSVELDGNPLSASPVLKAISSKRYWQLDVLSGSLAESQVILPVKDEDIVENAGEVVVAQSASLTDDFESIGQSAYNGTITNGFVTSNRAVTKNLIAIGIASGEEGLIVFNFVSPNEDQSNDFLIIGNIENFPENKFTLFNRWGDKVFEIENYDNNERAFRGKSNINGESDLVTGTYFYSIETMKDGKKLNGFLMVKN